MKSKVAVLALVALLVSAAQALAMRLPDSCGDDRVKFEVTTQNGQPAPAAPESGGAHLILIQTENHMVSPFHDATIRFGLDGAWAGATNGNSYFVLAIAPGVHHVCASWQSTFKALARNVDLTSFTAEAGRTYYLQADVNVESQYSVGFKLSQIDDDKGQYLVGMARYSTFKTKK